VELARSSRASIFLSSALMAASEPQQELSLVFTSRPMRIVPVFSFLSEHFVSGVVFMLLIVFVNLRSLPDDQRNTLLHVSYGVFTPPPFRRLVANVVRTFMGTVWVGAIIVTKANCKRELFGSDGSRSCLGMHRRAAHLMPLKLWLPRVCSGRWLCPPATSWATGRICGQRNVIRPC